MPMLVHLYCVGPWDGGTPPLVLSDDEVQQLQGIAKRMG